MTVQWVNMTAMTDRAGVEALEDWFWENGAVSVTVEDGLDQPIFEPPPGELPLWDRARVTGLFESGVDTRALTEALGRAGFELDSVAGIEDRPWEREWLSRFRPMQFGERLWICPTGYDIEDADDKVIVQLDPGLAFGTGTHETTRLCLEYLDACPPRDAEVIDYGCGSGILGIAAALLGAARVHGIDNDPQALTATRENARRNRVPIATDLPGVDPGPADLLIANILAQPLIDMAALLCGLTRPGGRLVLSGIMSAQADQVVEAYREKAELVDQTGLNGWVRLVWER